MLPGLGRRLLVWCRGYRMGKDSLCDKKVIGGLRWCVLGVVVKGENSFWTWEVARTIIHGGVAVGGDRC